MPNELSETDSIILRRNDSLSNLFLTTQSCRLGAESPNTSLFSQALRLVKSIWMGSLPGNSPKLLKSYLSGLQRPAGFWPTLRENHICSKWGESNRPSHPRNYSTYFGNTGFFLNLHRDPVTWKRRAGTFFHLMPVHLFLNSDHEPLWDTRCHPGSWGESSEQTKAPLSSASTSRAGTTLLKVTSQSLGWMVRARRQLKQTNGSWVRG